MEVQEIKNRLSTNIKKIRKAKGWSQFELAEKSDVSEQTINSIESKRLWPSEKTLAKISNALEIDIYKFFLPVRNSVFSSEEFSSDLRLAVVQSVQNLVEKTLQQYSN